MSAQLDTEIRHIVMATIKLKHIACNRYLKASFLIAVNVFPFFLAGTQLVSFGMTLSM
jgi:hypothetical protein